MTMTSVFAPIFKSQEQDDGTLMIYGKATGSDLDLDQQRCDPDWLKRAMPEWFKIGNIREQHDSKRAVGKATEHEIKDDGHYIKAHIVDPVAVAKTKAGVFTGLSIGINKPRLEKTADEEWIRDGLIAEVSLCDRPCLPTATFTMCKSAKPGMQINSADFDSQRMLVRVGEYVEKTVDPDIQKADAPEMTVKLSDALSPEQIEKLASVVAEKTVDTEVEKVTDVARTDAPNHSQTCVRCAEPGHLWCAPEGFDKDFAVGLVNETIEKASKGDGLGQDETGDISGAEAAIAAIAALIISEAQDLANMPSQGCDIHLLMSAVDALRIFACREKLEQGAIDPDSMVCLSAEPDATKAKDPKKPYGDVDYADPGYQSDGVSRYPLDSKAHAKSAWSYVNQADDADKYSADQLKKVKARIMAACKKFGVEISDDPTGSGKSVEPEKEKTVPVETTVEPSEEILADVVEKTYTLNEARAELGLPLFKHEGADDPDVVTVTESDVEKATIPEATKAVAEDTDPAADALVKALSAVLEKADSPLNKKFEAIQATTKATADQLGELAAEVEKVKQMAMPGGPAQRRTGVENKAARGADLLVELARLEAVQQNAEDSTLRTGAAQKAAQLRAEIKALAA